MLDDPREAAATAAEAGAEDARRRAIRTEVSSLGAEVGRRQAELGRIELAITNLERTWLFLEENDTTLVTDEPGATSPDVQMRIVEAQEAERARLAQEVHDGPAQTLSNAIFQVEYLERIIGGDPALARAELQLLRELLRRELGDVRSFITQLRPPQILEAGLEQAIRDATAQVETLAGITIALDLESRPSGLTPAQQTVALRIIQEALQNVRKHASARSATLATRRDGERWIAELRDDGVGFDVGAVAARGRRNFGLQFMRERAELIGAEFEVRSRPDGGTVVRLAIPVVTEEES
jgi:two-component system sensor histidine kinase DegS